MAKEKVVKKVPNTGNSEVDRLLREVERLEGVRSELIEKRESLLASNAELTAELRTVKESLSKAQEEIRNLKATMDLSVDKDRQKSEGFLEIVYVPPVPGIKVTPKYCNGVLFNSIIDEHGFHHWIYPIKQAKAVLGTHGSNHVLAGPVDSVEVEKLVGPYFQKVTVLRHVCRQIGSEMKWIPVTVEDSKEE